MYYKKLSVLLLIVFAASLYGMQEEKENPVPDWELCKNEYMNWSWQGFLASEKYWKPLKEGIESGALQYAPIDGLEKQEGFLTYVGPVQNKEEKALLVHQSPLWMYSLLINSKDPIAQEIYAATADSDNTFFFLGFEPKDKSSLPEGLHVNEKFLPGWKTNPRLVLWYYNLAKNGAQDWITKINILREDKKNEEPSKQKKDGTWCNVF
jgi:hypothetical protein